MENFKIYKTNVNTFVRLKNVQSEMSFDRTLTDQMFMTINMLSDVNKVLYSSRMKYVCFNDKWEEYKNNNVEYFI